MSKETVGTGRESAKKPRGGPRRRLVAKSEMLVRWPKDQAVDGSRLGRAIPVHWHSSPQLRTKQRDVRVRPASQPYPDATMQEDRRLVSRQSSTTV